MKPILTALLAALLPLTAPLSAVGAPSLRSAGGGVTLSIEGEAGQSLPTYYHRGTTYVMGDMGARYNVRVTNSSGERVEVVLTVDGRDAISGENGDWRSQRGYIVPAYGTVVVDGFRKNYSEVAAFRFTTRGDSYSGRRGTARNTGVVGAAVFREERPQHRAIAPPPRRPVEPYYYGEDSDWGSPEKKAGDGLGTGSYNGPTDSSAQASSPPAASPPAYDVGLAGRAEESRSEPMAKADKSSSADEAYGPRGGSAGYSQRPAPKPARRNNLGTQYGESRYSPVTETAFRRNRNSPDQLIGLYYDDAAGLSARGIAVYPEYSSGGPQPFPVNRRFAAPPP